MLGNGILPLSFKVRPDYNDRHLSKILVDSLDLHWAGKSPFFLRVIVPDDEFDTIAERLESTDRVAISLITESDCLGSDAKYLPRFDWWRREQLIKLLAMAGQEFNNALILNSDVICVADFDENTFIEDGKVVSDWEPKRGQSWWAGAAKLLGSSLDGFAPYGLSVVPNAVSCELARIALEVFADRYGHLPTFLMHAARMVPDQSVCWTDFSLYSLLGEMSGEMDKYHLPAGQAFELGRRVRSEQSIWSKEEFEAKAAAFDFANPGGVFMCVQSAAQIDPEQIRRRFLQPALATSPRGIKRRR